MNIVFCHRQSICEPGMTSAFKNLGHNVYIFNHSFSDKDLDKEYLRAFSEYLLNHQNADIVFSVNFIPLVAKACKIHKIPYLSYTVDSPSMSLYSKSLDSSYSYAFLFDKELYNHYMSIYPNNVYYLPLGADVDFYDNIKIDQNDHKKYDCDISFIGSFRSLNCVYDEIKDKLPEYMRGYAEGLIQAQLNVYGYYLIADSFSDEWALEFKKYADWALMPDYYEDIRTIVSDHYLGFKCTQADRVKTLSEISKHYDINLYTYEDTKKLGLPNIKNCGVADSKTMMPKIFKCSKINLNMTARTIKSGISQRIFDIMAAGGFVISNYQSEICELFTPDEDIVLYESIPDLLQKIDYYLNNEDARLRIAQNGYNKVKQAHTYEIRLKELLRIFTEQQTYKS